MDRSLDDFLHDLSSSAPVPGGGAAAAFQASVAASLVSMVCELTLGRKRFAHVQLQVERVRDEAVTLRDRAEHLMQDDIGAYGGVALAMKLPRATGEERATRRKRLQEALKQAAGPPLSMMEVSADVLAAAHHLVPICNSAVVSDVGVAALAARSAFYGARLNVEINLAHIDDVAWVQDVEETMRGFPDIDGLERTVLEGVARSMKGEGG